MKTEYANYDNLTYRIEAITPNGNMFYRFGHPREFRRNIWGQLKYLKNCNIRVTNNKKGKVYNEIPFSTIFEMAQPSNDIDSLLLTNYYIGEDTEDNLDIPIKLLYQIVGNIQETMILKAYNEVNMVLENDIRHRAETMYNLNKLVTLDDNRDETYINPIADLDLETDGITFTKKELPEDIQKRVEHINFGENEDVISTLNKWAEKLPRIRDLTNSWDVCPDNNPLHEPAKLPIYVQEKIKQRKLKMEKNNV